MISAMRSRCPTKRILIGKTDLDTAYRRIHTHANTASTCVAIVDELAFLCLRLGFDTTPAPAEYKTISEAEIDLGNDPLQDKSWDKNDLNSPHRPLIPTEEKHQSASHLAKADPLAVDITATEASMDGFIDDIITVTVDDDHWIDRAKKRGPIGHSCTIPTTTAIRTSETRRSTLVTKTSGRGTTRRAKDMLRLVHQHSIYQSFPTGR